MVLSSDIGHVRGPVSCVMCRSRKGFECSESGTAHLLPHTVPSSPIHPVGRVLVELEAQRSAWGRTQSRAAAWRPGLTVALGRLTEETLPRLIPVLRSALGELCSLQSAWVTHSAWEFS